VILKYSRLQDKHLINQHNSSKNKSSSKLKMISCTLGRNSCVVFEILVRPETNRHTNNFDRIGLSDFHYNCIDWLMPFRLTVKVLLFFQFNKTS